MNTTRAARRRHRGLVDQSDITAYSNRPRAATARCPSSTARPQALCRSTPPPNRARGPSGVPRPHARPRSHKGRCGLAGAERTVGADVGLVAAGLPGAGPILIGPDKGAARPSVDSHHEVLGASIADIGDREFGRRFRGSRPPWPTLSRQCRGPEPRPASWWSRSANSLSLSLSLSAGARADTRRVVRARAPQGCLLDGGDKSSSSWGFRGFATSTTP